MKQNGSMRYQKLNQLLLKKIRKSDYRNSRKNILYIVFSTPSDSLSDFHKNINFYLIIISLRLGHRTRAGLNLSIIDR
jgi:hypothetical protein